MSNTQLRSDLIKLASELPKGSPERKKILAVLQKKANEKGRVDTRLLKIVREALFRIGQAAIDEMTGHPVGIGDFQIFSKGPGEIGLRVVTGYPAGMEIYVNLAKGTWRAPGDLEE